MPQVSPPLYALNAGVVSKLALGRVDLSRLRVSGEVQENLLPRVVGPSVFRPGTAFMARTHGDADVRFIPFVFNTATTALIEVSQSVLRVLLDGVPLTRPTVTAAVSNGNFDTDLTGWTDADEAGATSAWLTGGFLSLTGTGTSFAIRTQAVTVTETGVEHALSVVVTRGPVVLAVGSTAGDDDYVEETPLRTGTHSLAFTPTGNFHISIKADANVPRLVTSINVEAAGILTIAHPWGADYTKLRYAQSGDVIFIACEDFKQRRIERRDQRSWSLAEYNTSGGPFRAVNAAETTITPSATSGSISLTASRPLFDAGHVGSLWRMLHSGQTATGTLTGEDQFTDSIRVTGVSGGATTANTRPFSIVITSLTGTGSTVTLQHSFGEPGSWVDVESYTANTTKTFDDGFDNQIVHYRLGVKAGNYVAGSIVATMTYASSVQQGIVRITAYTSATVLSAEVVETLGKATATSDWEEGEWSDYRGFPSSVAFHDGRLWWGWLDRVFGSVSDSFTNYDDNVEGDSGPVIRSVATGPVEGILWLLSIQRFLAGTASQEVSMRASSFDEPITPTAFTARDFSTRGCANLRAVKVDAHGVFVQRNTKRIYAAVFSVDAADYTSSDLTRLAIDVCEAGVVDIAVQRQPDTRVWFVLADGTCAVLTYEPEDEVLAWTTVTTNGLIKAVGILPGEDEDEVYLAVQRTRPSGAIMCVEKLTKLSECVGGTQSKNMDSHIVYNGSASQTVSGLGHLEGLAVVAWADGKPYPGPYTVTAGAIDFGAGVTVSQAVIGLAYDGKFQSSKLAHGAATGTAVSKQKRIDHVALLMVDVGWYGVTIGKDFTTMTRLPATLGNGRALVTTEVLETYDYAGAPFNGGWGPDSRVCFKVSSPYPATFLGVMIGMQTNEPQTFGTQSAG